MTKVTQQTNLVPRLNELVFLFSWVRDIVNTNTNISH